MDSGDHAPRDKGIGAVSARELSAMAAPEVERTAAAIRAVAEPYREARDLEAALRRILKAREEQVAGFWVDLQKDAGRELCAEIEIRLDRAATALISIRRSEGAARAERFAMSVKARKGELSQDALRAIGERIRAIEAAGASSDAAGELASAFDACEEVERAGAGHFEEPGARELDSSGELDSREALVGRMREEYALFFGRPPPIRRFRGARGASIEFPSADLPHARSFFHVPSAIRRSPAGAAYLRRIGFACDDEGTARIVPLPSTFIASRRAAGLSECGFVPRIVPRHVMGFFSRRWLLSSARGELAINLATRLYYAASRPLRRAALYFEPIRKDWISHFTTLGHDMSVHILSAHLVPRAILLHIGERVLRALNELPLPRRIRAPLPLLFFYDADFVRHVRDHWERSASLAEIPGSIASEDSLGELLDKLDRRIGEARSARARPFWAAAPRPQG